MAKKKQGSNTNHEVYGIAFIVFSVLFMMSLFSYKIGIVGLIIRGTMFPLMGFGAYFFPIIIFIVGINIFSAKSELLNYKNYILIFCLFLLSMILLDSGNIGTEKLWNRITLAINLSHTSKGGGIIGAFFGYFFYKIFGTVGGSILLLFLFSISIIILFNLNIKGFMKNLQNRFKYKEIKENKQSRIMNKKGEEPLSPNINTVINYNDLQSKGQLNNLERNDYLENKDVKTDKSKDTITNYKIPPIDLLVSLESKSSSNSKKEVLKNAQLIEETMNNFGIDAKVTKINKGPAITCYELSPSPGIKLSKIVSLSDNIALSLASSDIRIEAPIPGKSAVGIEVPNKIKDNVYLKEIINSKEFIDSDSVIPLALGKDVSGKIIVSSIDKMPHLLIAGATGSGKSVCINTIIMNIIYKSSPEDVRLLLIDPKVVELSVYNSIPHLLVPVVTDAKRASSSLNWAVSEMENRYKLFAQNNVRDIESYNRRIGSENIDKLSRIIIIIDELADLMMVAAQEIEDYIARLAQMARAAGIYLIVATQRPSVDVITGTIKANIPSRISFAVSSQIDSRTILDMSGAEKLLGKGDMLFYPSFYSKPLRIQGAFISAEEVEEVVSFLKSFYQHTYEEEIIDAIETPKNIVIDSQDELLSDAIKLVIDEGQASISFLQRKLRIGYARAARIIDEMESMQIVGGFEGSKPRKVLINIDDLDKLLS